MNGRPQILLQLLVAAMLLQSVAGNAAVICIGADHVAFASESGHACCEHGGSAPVVPAMRMAFEHECECIDVDLPANPLQLKRPGCGSEFDAPRSSWRHTGTSLEIADDVAPAAPLTHSNRAARTIILRI